MVSLHTIGIIILLIGFAFMLFTVPTGAIHFSYGELGIYTFLPIIGCFIMLIGGVLMYI